MNAQERYVDALKDSTPRPWEVYHYEDESDGKAHTGVQTDYPEALCNGARSIACMTGDALTVRGREGRRALIVTNKANAALIVQAVNAHEGMVSVLTRAREALMVMADPEHCLHNFPNTVPWKELAEQASAALAAAGK